MASYNMQSEGTSTMDKMKKLLSSPMARKKQPPAVQEVQRSNYFGVPLEDILLREGTEVPHLVTKICTYMVNHGIQQEGIFRVNGNAKVIEKMKQSFEMSGDANLEAAGDIMAVAAVLKLFLRQMPNGLIPEAETLEFVRIQEAYKSDKQACSQMLRQQLEKLEKPNYTTLKYLCKFLVTVAQYETSNKMNPMALGIVFGPNLFRCTLGVQGLKEQGITNHISLKFIQDYNTLFPDESPVSAPMQNGKKKPAPPRPPPPKFDDNNFDQSTTISNQPAITTTPKKGKQKYDGSSYYDSDGNSVQSSDAHTTQNISDEEFLETSRASPFPLETDRSEYSTHTSINHGNTEVVEKAISSAITEHLFGHESSSFSSEEAPVRPPRKKQRSRNENMDESYESLQQDQGSEEAPMNIKQRIQQFEADQNGDLTKPVDPNKINNRKQMRQSEAFQMFEKKGIVIGPAPSNLMQSLKYGGDGAEIAVESDDTSQDSVEEIKAPQPQPRSHIRNGDLNRHDHEVGDSGFNSVSRVEGTLASFKKPAGPKNRRNPTRRSMKGPDIDPDETESSSAPIKPRQFLPEQNQQHNNHHHHPPDNNHINTNHHHNSSNQSSSPSDVNHNNHHHQTTNNNNHTTKPSTKFLNIHFKDRHTSPEKSPVSDKHHPFVPPLDLSILHEHGDGNEPIPVKQGLSISLHKVQPSGTEDKAMISPRSDKIQKANLQHDPEIPPSPPMEQTRKTRSYKADDDYSQQVKTLTKRIQTCKRKIKNFEENFELDHGYRPSQTDKAARPEIKKYMQDLARTRKELRKIKEEQEHQRTIDSSPPGTTNILEGGSSTGEDRGPATMKETLHVLMKRLVEKRQEGDRPEDLMLMSPAQVQEEKLAVQKALLHFESLHGRPATKKKKVPTATLR